MMQTVSIPDRGGLFKTGGENSTDMALPIYARRRLGWPGWFFGLIAFALFTMSVASLVEGDRTGLLVLAIALAIAGVLLRCAGFPDQLGRPCVEISAEGYTDARNRRAPITVRWSDVEWAGMNYAYARHHHDHPFIVRLRRTGERTRRDPPQLSFAFVQVRSLASNEIWLNLTGLDVPPRTQIHAMKQLIARHGGTCTMPPTLRL